MGQGTIFNIQRFSIHDGPGIRSTVFFKGCPLRCSWCHNPESQRAKPELMHWSDRCVACGRCQSTCLEQAISLAPTWQVSANCRGCGACPAVCASGALELVGRVVTSDGLITELQQDELFFDQSGGGITCSGGEPLAQPAFLQELLTIAKRYHWHTAVDTCGYAPWSDILPLLPLVDLWLYDLKSLDDQIHREQTGVSNRLILENLERLSAAGSKVLVRVPVVPGVNDGPENWQQLISFLRPLALSGIKLLGYHRFGAEKYARLGLEQGCASVEPPSTERMAELMNELQTAGLPVVHS